MTDPSGADRRLYRGRYAKQVLFHGIGEVGQRRLAEAFVTIVGLGALGSVSAGHLCRAGVGRLRLVDRDFVELDNLQRQALYTEADAAQRLPKAVAAARALAAANGEVALEPLVEDVSAATVEDLIAGSDLVLDGTDNLETRFLLNDACLKLGIPWIYAGALGSTGALMAIVPGRTACLRCLVDRPPAPGALGSCETEGVIAPASATVASLQAAVALRLLVGHPPAGTLLSLDVWDLGFQEAEIAPRPDCPACASGEYSFLAGESTSWTTVLCGRDSVQIMPPEGATLSLEALAERLSRTVPVRFNGFLLSVRADEQELVLFPNGRAIVKGTTDERAARALYARYVGH